MYSCVNADFLQLLSQCSNGKYPEQVFIAGVDTDCCVLKTATDFFEHNIRPVVLTEYCYSNGGQQSHEAGILCMKRLIGEKQLIKAQINTVLDLNMI